MKVKTNKQFNMLSKFSLRYLTKNSFFKLVGQLEKELLIYSPNLEKEIKNELFRDVVKLVEFEPHSFCNRRCSFCPNIHLDRNKRHDKLDFSLYEKIIRDLAEIDYRKVVRFSRYCEPLACKDIVKYISLAKKYLPQSEVDLVTNGDFLNKESLQKVRDAGLSTLRISIYPEKKSEWTYETVNKQIHNIAERIGKVSVLQVRTEDYLQWKFEYEKMEIYGYANNLDKTGFDRGQTLPNLMDENFTRISPCLLVFNNVTIDYNGAVMPCCNLLSDIEEHKGYIIDYVARQKSIVDIYFSEKLTTWRRTLLPVGAKKPPCSTCKQKAMTDHYKLRSLKRKTNAKLRKLGIQLENLPEQE